MSPNNSDDLTVWTPEEQFQRLSLFETYNENRSKFICYQCSRADRVMMDDSIKNHPLFLAYKKWCDTKFPGYQICERDMVRRISNWPDFIAEFVTPLEKRHC